MRAAPRSTHPQTDVLSPDSSSAGLQSPGSGISQPGRGGRFHEISLGCAEVSLQCPTS